MSKKFIILLSSLAAMPTALASGGGLGIPLTTGVTGATINGAPPLWSFAMLASVTVAVGALYYRFRKKK